MFKTTVEITGREPRSEVEVTLMYRTKYIVGVGKYVTDEGQMCVVKLEGIERADIWLDLNGSIYNKLTNAITDDD